MDSSINCLQGQCPRNHAIAYSTGWACEHIFKSAEKKTCWWKLRDFIPHRNWKKVIWRYDPAGLRMRGALYVYSQDEFPLGASPRFRMSWCIIPLFPSTFLIRCFGYLRFPDIPLGSGLVSMLSGAFNIDLRMLIEWQEAMKKLPIVCMIICHLFMVRINQGKDISIRCMILRTIGASCSPTWQPGRGVSKIGLSRNHLWHPEKHDKVVDWKWGMISISLILLRGARYTIICFSSFNLLLESFDNSW